MKIGMSFLGIGPFSAPEPMTHLAQKSEQCGFESLWMADHSAIPDGHKSSCPYTPDGRIPPWGEATPLNEPIAALSYIAALTSKVRLGTGVMILPQRHPFYVAKEVATLDIVSRGRALLGIGSGWCAEEFDALGLDFRQRGKRTDEALQSLRALWRDDPSTFKGAHFSFERIRSFPKPVQKGGVPILIGGHSRAAARRAARLGDGFYPVPPASFHTSEAANLGEFKRILTMFKEECAKAGRNPDEVELSTNCAPSLDTIRRYEDLGVKRVVFGPPGWERDELERALEKMGNEITARV